LPKELHRNVYLVKHALCAVYLPDALVGQAIAINALPKRAFELHLTQKEV
jgi:hypothetical protein